jgi:hypothetical protein
LQEGRAIPSATDDFFVLFVRTHDDTAGPGEWPLAACPSYEDARRMRAQLGYSTGDFVIRFVGPAGGD